MKETAASLPIFLAALAPSLAAVEQDEDGNYVEFAYATMSDGVKIAVAVGFPEGLDPRGQAQKWPAILEMSGYPNATQPVYRDDRYGGRYVTVSASLRGTGASGGLYAPFGERTISDGYEIIEDWIVKQSWSNGKVGIHGHSWSGLTGFLVASSNPPHLSAVVVSGLFDDSYRGISRIGGIRNIGFDVTQGVLRQNADPAPCTIRQQMIDIQSIRDRGAGHLDHVARPTAPAKQSVENR